MTFPERPCSHYKVLKGYILGKFSSCLVSLGASIAFPGSNYQGISVRQTLKKILAIKSFFDELTKFGPILLLQIATVKPICSVSHMDLKNFRNVLQQSL